MKSKGLSLKNIRYFDGPEGTNAQGDIYLEGRKIAFWSMDSYGESDHFESNIVDVQKLRRKMVEGHRKVEFLGMELDYTPEMFMGDLLRISESGEKQIEIGDPISIDELI